VCVMNNAGSLRAACCFGGFICVSNCKQCVFSCLATNHNYTNPYVCAHMHAGKYSHPHPHTHTQTHTRTYTHIHTRTHTRTYTYKHTPASLHYTPTDTHTYTYKHTPASLHVTPRHTHTRTNTNTPASLHAPCCPPSQLPATPAWHLACPCPASTAST